MFTSTCHQGLKKTLFHLHDAYIMHRHKSSQNCACSVTEWLGCWVKSMGKHGKVTHINVDPTHESERHCDIVADGMPMIHVIN